MEIKLSIIIPCFNVEKYLENALSSCINQSLNEIEIICVNDGSTDNTLQILQKFASQDNRIKLINFEQNKGTLTARCKGIKSATGKYIMFLDPDDSLMLHACDTLYNEMEKSPVDILQFASKVVNVGGVPQGRLNWIENFVKPYEGTLTGSQVLTACFRDEKYGFYVWNKIYNAQICKKAVEHVQDEHIVIAEDKYLYMLFAFYAQSFRGIDNQCHIYNFGYGCTGQLSITLNQFERFCRQAIVANLMEQFLCNQGYGTEYADIIVKNRDQLLGATVGAFLDQVASCDKTSAFDMMLRYWHNDEVIAKIAQWRFWDRIKISKMLQGAKSLNYDGRKIKTVAAYYHRIQNGGAERVLVSLCHFWAQMGYNIIVFTDEQPSDRDYELPDGTKHIVIPDCRGMQPSQYHDRATAIKNLIQQNNVDAVVYHDWVGPTALWDALVIKTSTAACIMHTHNVFSSPFINSWGQSGSYITPYPHADAIITLSKTDNEFWRFFNNNVFDTINPFTEKLENWPVQKRDANNHHIVWVARLSPEKNPLDLPKIMAQVVKQVPDCVLHIVGSSTKQGDHYFEDTLHSEIESLGLQNNVILEGFQKDVKPYYYKAKIYLMTSTFEGYPLSLQEAKMAGLPIVMYELPYLTLTQGERGIIQVPQNDIHATAQALIGLLNDDEKCQKLAYESRKHVEELYTFDFKQKWRTIFESVENRTCQADIGLVGVERDGAGESQNFKRDGVERDAARSLSNVDSEVAAPSADVTSRDGADSNATELVAADSDATELVAAPSADVTSRVAADSDTTELVAADSDTTELVAADFYKKMMMETLLTHNLIGTNKLRSTIRDLECQRDALQNEIDAVRHCHRYRVGSILLWFPSKVKALLRCLKHHGFKYTAKKVWHKLIRCAH